MAGYDWRYENSINYTKEYHETEGLVEHRYSPWRTNSSLSFFADTVLYANDMNMYSFLDSKLQYEYLLHSVRKRKRFFKRDKKHDDVNHSLIRDHYKYSDARAREALRLLTDEQLAAIREKEEKGGT